MSEQSVTEFYNEGLEHTKSGNWDEAIECLNKAIGKDPKHVNSYNALGKVYQQRGDLDTAKRCWRTALRIDPGNVTAKQCLESTKEPAQLRARALLWVAAVVVLVLAALIISNVILLRRISSLENELKLARAVAHEGQDSELNVQDELAQAGKQAPPEEIAERPIDKSPPVTDRPTRTTQTISPDTPSTAMEVYNQALADCRSGWYSQAITGFEKVLENPSHRDLEDNAQYWLAECYYAQKEYDRALAEFQKVGRSFPKGNKVFDAELKIAYTYYNLGRIEEAKRKLSQVSEKWPHRQYQARINALAEKIR